MRVYACAIVMRMTVNTYVAMIDRLVNLLEYLSTSSAIIQPYSYVRGRFGILTQINLSPGTKVRKLNINLFAHADDGELSHVQPVLPTNRVR